MTNAFAERLRGHGPLSADDVALLTAACSTTRALRAGYHLIREGDRPDPVFVMLEGWACRYKILPDGGRQIMAFMLPGDFCDIHIAVLEEMDHSIVTLTKARVASLPRRQMEALVEARPAITRAFWWSQLVDQGVLRAWIVSMGRRKSVQRVAHLMCELYIRMRNIGPGDRRSVRDAAHPDRARRCGGADPGARQPGAQDASGREGHGASRRIADHPRRGQAGAHRGLRRQLFAWTAQKGRLVTSGAFQRSGTVSALSVAERCIT